MPPGNRQHPRKSRQGLFLAAFVFCAGTYPAICTVFHSLPPALSLDAAAPPGFRMKGSIGNFMSAVFLSLSRWLSSPTGKLPNCGCRLTPLKASPVFSVVCCWTTSAWDRVSDILMDADFYRHEHRLIYASIGTLINGEQAG